MELRWLTSFVAVATELNYSRAAEALHLSQPAVSQHIRQLEASVRVKLVERSTRAVALTRAGLAFLPLAQEVLDRADEAADIPSCQYLIWPAAHPPCETSPSVLPATARPRNVSQGDHQWPAPGR
jgi:DNA-binding transcriptional LysR family regulator